MSQRMWNSDHGPLRGFYRDSDQAWIFGACAGIADRFNFRVGMVRLITVIAFLLFSWFTFAVRWGVVADTRKATSLLRSRHGI